jgi:benzoyl-CoA reductase/2-hydroxyglutaryl-CoA dehydratase subunit BcrC/BadD/HgdB
LWRVKYLAEVGDNPTIVGITSTIPVEIVFAAGLKPVDLNNIFITSDTPERLIAQAESAGFSHNICAWIKGIYSIIVNRNVKTVIAVTGGDCSNTVALTELLAHKGVQVITFDYPHNREKDLLIAQMEKLGRSLSVNQSDIQAVKMKLDRIRGKLRDLDRLTFQNNVVTGLENHYFLVSSSDFKSDPALYERELDEFLLEAGKREPKKDEIRLGYLGVPPIFGHFYEYIESHGARVVFNEIQRQFSMPTENGDIIEQYLNYTYPYDVNRRIEDIRSAIDERDLDGLIHYTQTFCFRQIYDIIMRETLPLPILTLEGDRPGNIDSRTAVRIETFIEMLKDKN